MGHLEPQNLTFSTSFLLPSIKSPSAWTTQGYLSFVPSLIPSSHLLFWFLSLKKNTYFGLQIIARTYQKFYIHGKAFWTISSHNASLFLLHALVSWRIQLLHYLLMSCVGDACFLYAYFPYSMINSLQRRAGQYELSPNPIHTSLKMLCTE